MPLASHLGEQGPEYEKDDTPHLGFVHRTLNEAAIDCNDSAMRQSAGEPERRLKRIQVYALIFQTPPKPFNKDIIHPSAFSGAIVESGV